jgi:hypothetical protein
MRKEFMIYVFSEGNAKASLSPSNHLEFVKIVKFILQN